MIKKVLYKTSLGKALPEVLIPCSLCHVKRSVQTDTLCLRIEDAVFG